MANELQGFNGDPADRIIVATALVGGHTLLTADRSMLEWSRPVRRANARR